MTTQEPSGESWPPPSGVSSCRHRVLLHARNDQRAEAAAAAPEVVIHNAGVLLTGSGHRPVTEDGLETTFQVNVLAPYLLTALLPRPARLIYLTSGLESSGTIDLADLQRERRRWDGYGAYSDSKLADIVLALAVARRWPGTLSNAVDPGWIASRMGGRGAPAGCRKARTRRCGWQRATSRPRG